MSKRFDLIRYNFDQFDANFCLKPSPLLLACIAFLCRDFALPLLSAVASLKGGSSDFTYLLSADHYLLRLSSNLPAVLIFYSLANRMPGGNGFARWIWKHGRMLLLATAFLQALEIISISPHSSAFIPLNWVDRIAVAGNTLIVLYLLFSRRTRETFQDFPELEQQRSGAKS